MRAALPAVADEFVAVLKVVMALDESGDVIARVKRRAVQRFNEANLILLDHRGVHESHEEQPRLSFSAAFKRGRVGQYSIGARCKDIDLGSFLSAGRNELLGVLKIAVIVNRLGKQTARVELGAIGRCNDADFALRENR